MTAAGCGENLPPRSPTTTSDWPPSCGTACVKGNGLMDLNQLAQGAGEWLRGAGTDADIVISSRLRVARNLADFPFFLRSSEIDRREIERTLRQCAEALDASR